MAMDMAKRTLTFKERLNLEMMLKIGAGALQEPEVSSRQIACSARASGELGHHSAAMPRRGARGKSLYGLRGRLAAAGREAVWKNGLGMHPDQMPRLEQEESEVMPSPDVRNDRKRLALNRGCRGAEESFMRSSPSFLVTAAVILSLSGSLALAQGGGGGAAGGGGGVVGGAAAGATGTGAGFGTSGSSTTGTISPSGTTTGTSPITGAGGGAMGGAAAGATGTGAGFGTSGSSTTGRRHHPAQALGTARSQAMGRGAPLVRTYRRRSHGSDEHQILPPQISVSMPPRSCSPSSIPPARQQCPQSTSNEHLPLFDDLVGARKD